MMSAWVRLGVLSVGLLTGCASGTGGLSGDDNPVKPVDAGVDAAASEDAGEVDAGFDAGEQDAGADAGEVDAGDPCEATSTCAQPTMLGMVRGDTNDDRIDLNGVGNAFVAVYVKEDNGSIIRVPIKVSATLESPPGANFDLIMYAEQDSCGAVTDSSTTNFSDMVATSWDEGLTSSDDSRTVLFEIRHVSGDCSAAFPWKLEVRGNNP
jgi:hypothetical protein